MESLAGSARIDDFRPGLAKRGTAKHEFEQVCRPAPGSQFGEVLLALLMFRFALFMPRSGYGNWPAGQLPEKTHNVFDNNTLHNREDVDMGSGRGVACPRLTSVTKASRVSPPPCPSAGTRALPPEPVPFRRNPCPSTGISGDHLTYIS